MTEVVPKARNADPETSHEAASSVGRLTETRKRVLRLLEVYGPMTDLELKEMYLMRYRAQRLSESGLRSRRSELVQLGLVEDSGERTTLASGRKAIIWKIKEAADG